MPAPVSASSDRAQLATYRDYFTQVRHAIQTWNEAVAVMHKHVANICNLIERVQCLEQQRHLPVLTIVDGSLGALVARHVQLVDVEFTSLQDIITTLKKSSRVLTAVSDSALAHYRTHSYDNTMSIEAVITPSAGSPSIFQCIEWLLAFSDAYSAEFLRIKGLIDRLGQARARTGPTVNSDPSAMWDSVYTELVNNNILDGLDLGHNAFILLGIRGDDASG
eukprot:TRINITY_DN10857_c0_g1_i1.p1 TRINITY_DN10857_c0_g1~~TRINITY_DN10857_c0_g1_i1.p1  ORF type:complete len:221 (-),score=26.85 TRINITY_DN10857_c0_g1_i1:344-1006(-)